MEGTILLVVVFRVDLHQLGVSGWSESTSTSRSVAAAARASLVGGQTRTVLGWQWRVAFLVQRGVKGALWGNKTGTGARGETSMAARSSGSHGGSTQKANGEGAAGAIEA